MSKKSAKQEDLVDSIQDDKIINVLMTHLTPFIEELFRKLAGDLTATVKQISKDVSVEVMSSFKETTLEKIHQIEEETSSLRSRLEDIENYSRLENLVIHGLPEKRERDSTPEGSRHGYMNTAEEATAAILDLCQTQLGLEITKSDISIAHRIPSRGKDKYRPIIVKFTSRRSRNLVYSARRSLRQHHPPDDGPIFVNEHLTRLNATIFAQARKSVREKKIFSTWTSGGHVFIRSTDSETQKPKRINQLQDLQFLT